LISSSGESFWTVDFVARAGADIDIGITSCEHGITNPASRKLQQFDNRVKPKLYSSNIDANPRCPSACALLYGLRSAPQRITRLHFKPATARYCGYQTAAKGFSFSRHGSYADGRL